MTKPKIGHLVCIREGVSIAEGEPVCIITVCVRWTPIRQQNRETKPERVCYGCTRGKARDPHPPFYDVFGELGFQTGRRRFKSKLCLLSVWTLFLNSVSQGLGKHSLGI